MRYIVFFIFLSFSTFAQTTNISVVSAEKVNIVYRGIDNPIKIAVPRAKSFTATAPGLKQVDSLGNYELRPGIGKEVIVSIDAVMEDGLQLKEEKVFRILNMPPLLGQIEGRESDCDILFMTKEQVCNATVKVNWQDFLFIKTPDLSTVKRFSVTFHDEEKGDVYKNEGSTMSKETIGRIKKLKKGDLIFIHQIVYLEDTTHITPKRAQPIVIELVD